MYAIITPMKYLRHLLIVLLAIIILGGTLVASVSAYSSPPPPLASVVPQTVYHQPGIEPTLVTCTSGVMLAQVYHFPQPGTTTWSGRFMAQGGDFTTRVSLDLPLGYGDDLDIPPGASSNAFTITVTTPAYTGYLPVMVTLYASPLGCPATVKPLDSPLAPSQFWATQVDVR
jgi:hypothetical protein